MPETKQILNEEPVAESDARRAAMKMTFDILESLPLDEIKTAYGFILGLQAKQPAA